MASRIDFGAHSNLGRPLRILIVDDNHVNLSVLTRLLRRRFSPLVEGSPVAVDSGLKAIQLLRTHIFDLILMDIQMPFLSGLEATRRIRKAEDGILSANRNAHIVAVTTAVGAEPEIVYRRALMDGMISKPVRFQHLQQYLTPLAHEANVASQSVSLVNVDGEDVMPPLPLASQHDRVFYLPSDTDTPSSRPDICEGSDFEVLLEAQTRMSLRRCSTVAIARSGSSSGVSLRPLPQPLVYDRIEGGDQEGSSTSSSTSSRSNSSSTLEKLVGQSQSSGSSNTPSQVKPSRAASMTISHRTLTQQIAREVTNAGFDGMDESDCSMGSSQDSQDSEVNAILPRLSHPILSRAPLIHRTSSPSWLVSDDDVSKHHYHPHHHATLPIRSQMTRPKLTIAGLEKASGSSFGSSGDSDLFSPPLRRESQVSSTSTISDASSVVSTPSCEEGPAPLYTPQHNSSYFEEKCQSSMDACYDGQGYDVHNQLGKGVWNPSSDTLTNNSSPRTMQSPLQTSSEDEEWKAYQGKFRGDALNMSPLKHRTVGRKRGIRLNHALDLAESVERLKLAGS